MRDLVFLDHNSTTYMKSDVRDALSRISGEPTNASSIHSFGRNARKIIEDARIAVGQSLGLKNFDKYRIVFTSSGTEANNLAIRGLGLEVLASSIEHPSISKATIGEAIKVDENGLVDFADLKEKLENGGKKLVSIMFANNETGVVQNIKEIAKLVHEYGGLLHTDAVQAYGKISFDINELDVDLMTVSSHKIGGPIGAAALIFRKNLNVEALIKGGGQEQGARSGTENVSAILGFGIAASSLAKDIDEYSKIESLRNYLEDYISAYSDKVKIFSKNSLRLPNTSCIYTPNINSETQVINFDLNGVAISAGSACSSGRISASSSILSMGFSKEIAGNAIRISLGTNTTKAEIDRFLTLWQEMYKRHN